MSIKTYYQHCIVPSCGSNSKGTPSKLFIKVPHQLVMRKQWLNLAGRELNDFSPKSTIYFCGDHFDLPNDMQNFMEYRIRGSVKKLWMKEGCVPSRFEHSFDKKDTVACSNTKIIENYRLEFDQETSSQENSSTLKFKNCLSKRCFVKNCTNNSQTQPQKLFISVPRETYLRNLWCEAANIIPPECNKALFCCEDHFDMENDMENTTAFRKMNGRVEIMMKHGVVPHFFNMMESSSEEEVLGIAPDYDIMKTSGMIDKSIVSKLTPIPEYLPELKFEDMRDSVEVGNQSEIFSPVEEPVGKDGVVTNISECELDLFFPSEKSATDQQKEEITSDRCRDTNLIKFISEDYSYMIKLISEEHSYCITILVPDENLKKLILDEHSYCVSRTLFENEINVTLGDLNDITIKMEEIYDEFT